MAKYHYRGFQYPDQEWSLIVEYPPGVGPDKVIRVERSRLMPGEDVHGVATFVDPILMTPPETREIRYQFVRKPRDEHFDRAHTDRPRSQYTARNNKE